MFELRKNRESRSILCANQTNKYASWYSFFIKKKTILFNLFSILVLKISQSLLIWCVRLRDHIESLNWILIHYCTLQKKISNKKYYGLSLEQKEIKVASFVDFDLYYFPSNGKKEPNWKSNGVLNNWFQLELILNFLSCWNFVFVKDPKATSRKETIAFIHGLRNHTVRVLIMVPNNEHQLGDNIFVLKLRPLDLD